VLPGGYVEPTDGSLEDAVELDTVPATAEALAAVNLKPDAVAQLLIKTLGDGADCATSTALTMPQDQGRPVGVSKPRDGSVLALHVPHRLRQSCPSGLDDMNGR
jgi:hypothetical protein